MQAVQAKTTHMNHQLSQAIDVVSIHLQTSLATLLNDIGNLPEALMADLAEKGIDMQGPMIFIYRNCTGDMSKPFDLEIAQPVAKATVYEGPYQRGTLEPFTYVERRFKGSLEHIGPQGYEPFIADLQAAGFTLSDQCREVYTQYEGYDAASNLTDIQMGIVL